MRRRPPIRSRSCAACCECRGRVSTPGPIGSRPPPRPGAGRWRSRSPPSSRPPGRPRAAGGSPPHSTGAASSARSGLVAGLMRDLGLAAVGPRAYKRTTVPGKEPVSAPDLIDRDFTAPAPGQRLVGDITYLRTGEGWLYLATVIDLATRMVVGWQTAAHMRTVLVTDALQMAIA